MSSLSSAEALFAERVCSGKLEMLRDFSDLLNANPESHHYVEKRYVGYPKTSVSKVTKLNLVGVELQLGWGFNIFIFIDDIIGLGID